MADTALKKTPASRKRKLAAVVKPKNSEKPESWNKTTGTTAPTTPRTAIYPVKPKASHFQKNRGSNARSTRGFVVKGSRDGKTVAVPAIVSCHPSLVLAVSLVALAADFWPVVTPFLLLVVERDGDSKMVYFYRLTYCLLCWVEIA
ncbi:hypothetical protein [Aquaspirillum soli]